MNRVEKLLIKAQEISEIKRKERLRNMTDEELDNRIEQLRTELGISVKNSMNHRDFIVG